MVWTLFWKALALWTSVKQEQKGWFIAILVLNTAGILEIVYFFMISNKNIADIKTFFSFKRSEGQTTE